MLKSILDTDLYKLTMQQAVHRLYPWAEAEYTFINRGGTEFPQGFAAKLRLAIEELASLRLTREEKTYLAATCPYLTPVYLDFLRSYRFNPSEVHISQPPHGNLSVSVRGPWYRTILWEVPLMAMISELYFQETMARANPRPVRQETNTLKGESFVKSGARLVDFGTRRRFSCQNQDEVLYDLLAVTGSTLVGTSNVYFARKYGIKPIGTHAHEWFMYHGAINGYRAANPTALDAWMRVYQGALGIALTDTYTTKAFFSIFDAVKSRLFDGARHDSGDPFDFADAAVAHYEKLLIDPFSKTSVFSDGISSTDTVARLQRHCAGRIKTSFGIGTFLTNDVGVTPLNIVIKMTSCREHPNNRWVPTVKLSDAEGKHTGDKAEVKHCLDVVSRIAP